MRSVQVSKPKGPFELVERDIPEPGARKVRIKVQACGICHGDSVTKGVKKKSRNRLLLQLRHNLTWRK